MITPGRVAGSPEAVGIPPQSQEALRKQPLPGLIRSRRGSPRIRAIPKEYAIACIGSLSARRSIAGLPGVIAPTDIQAIGNELAIRWQDGTESFIAVAALRAASPSAEVQGEGDIFGQRYGGGAGTGAPDVEILGWKPVGNYAIQFHFSDGHRTGLYTYDYLRELGEGTAER